MCFHINRIITECQFELCTSFVLAKISKKPRERAIHCYADLLLQLPLNDDLSNDGALVAVFFYRRNFQGV